MYFLPARLLQITTNSIDPYANWNSSLGEGDPWVGNPYQWTVSISISAQQHSSQLTSTPFYYNGNDVIVGDWLADITLGLSVKIVSIVSQDVGTVVAICEDVDRFNTFSDPTGNGTGIGGTGPGFLFTLNDESLPIFAGMTQYQTGLINNLAFISDQMARFQYRNYLKTFYRVDQPGNTFVGGELLTLGPDINGNAVFSTVTPSTPSTKVIVGQVNSIGSPGPDWFTFRPSGRVVTNLNPALPGVPGDLIYLSANAASQNIAGVTGTVISTNLSNVAPTSWATPVYIQLDVNTTGIAIDRGVDTVGSLGYVNKTTIVPDTNTANTVLSTSNPGDQIMIDNSGSGEWAHFLVHDNAANLRQIANQDAVRVDAETLEVMINPATILSNISVNGQNMTGLLMGNVSANRTITLVSVQVSTAFTSNVTVTVGTNAVVDVIMSNALIDLTMLGSYSYNPGLEFTSPYTPVYAFINYNGSTVGNATITVTYT